MKKIAPIKVGILTLVSISLLVVILFWLRGRGLMEGEFYTVRFKDVDGMREGAPVQIMGIRIGFVETVKPIKMNGKYFVEVKFGINNPDVKVAKGSTLSIEQSGLIGEKFLEITPPQLKDVTITTFQGPAKEVTEGIPVKFLYEDGFLSVGKVEKVVKVYDENLVRNRLYYRITLPGAAMPKDHLHELVLDENNEYFLRILPQDPIVMRAPDKELVFTIENPLRLKKFLEIQMDSAAALKVTNEKVNQLLSDETIATMNNTLKNTEVLTATATEVLDSAREVFNIASQDLESLVKTSENLAENLTQVSENLNGIIGDPQFKEDILETVSSVQESTETLSELISDPALKDTLALTKETTENAAALLKSLRETAHERDFENRMDKSLTLLNESLEKLSTVLSNVEELTGDDDENIKTILKETKETSENLKTFSEKLNKRFLLFRLMF